MHRLYHSMSGEAGRGQETKRSYFRVTNSLSPAKVAVIHRLHTSRNALTSQRYAYISTGHPNLTAVLACGTCRRLLEGGFKVHTVAEADARGAQRDWGIDLDSRSIG